MNKLIKQLGPGFLFAGAAIGVSHLVQSTRAGADYGWGLIWALIIANLFKYPFFEYGTRYALTTNKSLLDGYLGLGKGYLWSFFFLSLGSMFTIQTAVTIVTASLASLLFGFEASLIFWSVIITTSCALLLWYGGYQRLDKIIKWIIFVLTISTVIAVTFAANQNSTPLSYRQIIPEGASIVFLAAFMGWMPAPLDISVWNSLWTLEKNQLQSIKLQQGLFDFNVGYLVTFFLGICFMALGVLVMYGSGTSFSNAGGAFANQLIELYTSTLGNEVYLVIVIAAFTTMFSTTLTTLDASPRAMERSSQLLFKNQKILSYRFWLIVLSLGTLGIFTFLLSEMGTLVQIATVLSFITAPFYAILNYRLVTSDQMPLHARPSKSLRILSLIGIILLSLFAVGFVFIAA